MMNSRKLFVELRHAKGLHWQSTTLMERWNSDSSSFSSHHFHLLFIFISSSLSYHHFHLVFIFSPFSSSSSLHVPMDPEVFTVFCIRLFCPRQSSFPVAAGPLRTRDEADVPPPSLMEQTRCGLQKERA